MCKDHGGLKMLLQYLIKFTPIHEFFSHAKVIECIKLKANKQKCNAETLKEHFIPLSWSVTHVHVKSAICTDLSPLKFTFESLQTSFHGACCGPWWCGASCLIDAYHSHFVGGKRLQFSHNGTVLGRQECAFVCGLSFQENPWLEPVRAEKHSPLISKSWKVLWFDRST